MHATSEHIIFTHQLGEIIEVRNDLTRFIDNYQENRFPKQTTHLPEAPKPIEKKLIK